MDGTFFLGTLLAIGTLGIAVAALTRDSLAEASVRRPQSSR